MSGIARSDQAFYVSTQGNDAWSGQLAAPNAGKTDGPLATIVGARNAVRRMKVKQGGLQEPVTVQLRGGVYYVPETITFAPEDSGTKECPISYTAYPGEKPELVGGKRITGLKPAGNGTMWVYLPEVQKGKWHFRQLFVNGERQVRARCPNVDPSDPYQKGFFYADCDPTGFGVVVGNIHNVGDWMEYDIDVPADGEYTVWVFYGHKMLDYKVADMGGHTALTVDGGDPIPLMNLPDTGGWGEFKWSNSASVKLTQGKHVLRWQNLKGGGLGLEAFVLCDDPGWKPVSTDLPQAAAGKRLLVIQAENFARFNGRQLSTSGTGHGSKTEFNYAPGTFKPSWATRPDAEVHIFQSGDCRAFKEIIAIAGVDEKTRKVKLKGKECLSFLRAGDRYFVDNLFDEMDSPGEWYLDTNTSVLHYRPVEGFSEKSEVVAPILGRLIHFAGDASKSQSVSHIRLSGLTLRNTDYSPDDGCAGYGMGHEGVVHLANANHCAITNCTFSNVGRHAVCAHGGGDHSITGNDISNSAQGGVMLLSSARNTVSDNHIHHCGAIYKHHGGVVIQGEGADDNIVAHNDVHDVSRYGISIKNGGLRNVIEYNRVRNTNLETYDTGGIEVTQHDKELRSGSTIRYNIVGDSVGYSSQGEKPVFLSWGIYLDSFAGGYDVNHNVVYRNNNGGIMLQGGKDNKVTNNIFVDGAVGQGHISNFSQNSTGQLMERNIFAWSNAAAILFATGTPTQAVIRVDNNVYWCGEGVAPRVGWGAKDTFADWQTLGFDTHSVVADPLFVDAENDDYSLKHGSPAFQLGIEPIDTSNIGLLRQRCECRVTRERFRFSPTSEG
ncbi:MAG: hypothetical protein GW893_22175 [Armatimonadetes bacterium]|nr:hypothetical protein [Armatimonadota bacterium]